MMTLDVTRELLTVTNQRFTYASKEELNDLARIFFMYKIKERRKKKG